MRRTFLLSLLLLLVTTAASAQNFQITGAACETKSQQPVEFATIALLRPDSTAISSTVTDEQGRFILRPKTAGDYIVKASYAGFSNASTSARVTEEADSVDIGQLLMQSDDNMLGVATVSVAASRVQQKEDTTMFNAAAYRVAEGSTLEALVKQLPGMEVDDNGTIKWNGKTITEFLINGKDFFKGDTETAMKNLPTELVSKIKAYDKKSDYAEQTGIDDGEENTVLDITTKRELDESWITNVDVAYGSHDRYMGRIFVSRFTERTRVSAFGGANNTNNRGYGSPRGFGGGGGGNTASYMGGLSFSWQNDKERTEPHRLELGGNVRFRLSNSDTKSTSNSETFLTSGANNSFSNSRSDNFRKTQGLNTDFRLQWNPDTMTTVTFRPSYSFSKNNNDGTSQSATFSDNPYNYSQSPLDSIMIANDIDMHPELYAIMVNINNRASLGSSHSHSVNGDLNFVRKLSSKGRNVSFRARGGYSTSESESFSISDISYHPSSGRDHSFLNQYSFTPSKNYNYGLRAGYVEPLGKNWFAEARYQFNYKYQDSDRRRYNLDRLGDQAFADEPWYDEFKAFGGQDGGAYPPIGSLPTRDDALNAVRDLQNSQYATYKYTNHTATAGVRYNTAKTSFNVGVDFNPERTRMDYTKGQLHIDTVRKVFNVSPTLRFRYKFSKTDQIDIRYRGSSSQPSMTDLIAVVDDSNPLAISMGNPGLKPSWNNSLRVNYNAYNATRQQGMMAGIDASLKQNSLSNRIVYDEATGVRYTRPENINGNWNARGMFMFNSAMGQKKLFNISTFTSLSYDNAVGYVSRMQRNGRAAAPAFGLVPLADPARETVMTYDDYDRIFANAASEKNTTKTVYVNEDLNASYRTSWFDVGLLGRLGYQHARATVQDKANMDTWNFAYGANANFNFNFGLSISTDIRMSSRRGYSESSMNTNELLWNAQISQSFLKNRAATVSIQFYDILQQQNSISRSLTATQRTDSWTNSINSYFLVHFIYKLNTFGGKGQGAKGGNNRGERQGPPDMRGQGGMPSRSPMMPMGGGHH